MAIRERFRRVLRKSDDSDTISQTDSNITTASSTRQSSSSETSSPPLQKTTTTTTTTSSSTLSRTFTFGRRDKDKDKEKAKEKQKEKERKKAYTKTWRHPSEKPLTAQNLKHQEILNQFTMTFGTRNPSQIEDLDFNGVSPCCTRPCSIDGGSR